MGKISKERVCRVKYDIGTYQILKDYKEFKIILISSTKDRFTLISPFFDRTNGEMTGYVLNRYSGKYDATAKIGQNGVAIIKTPITNSFHNSLMLESYETKAATAYLEWKTTE